MLSSLLPGRTPQVGPVCSTSTTNMLLCLLSRVECCLHCCQEELRKLKAVFEDGQTVAELQRKIRLRMKKRVCIDCIDISQTCLLLLRIQVMSNYYNNLL